MPQPESQNAIQKKSRLLKYAYVPVLTLIILMCISNATTAQTSTPASPTVSENTQWVLFTGCLVFFMNAGFAMLESGFCRSANAITVLAKNLIVFGIATLAFWILGFAFMFGDGSDFIGTSGFFLEGSGFKSLQWANIPLPAKFFFQLTFAGTAATIVSGAVAERIKFAAFMAFSFFLVLSYAITGHWIWGGGFLDNLGFRDFAGSTVVHSVGGWSALMGSVLLKPRLGKYRKLKPNEKRSKKDTSFYGKKIISMPAHNLSIATLGCFILWLGWYGFNAGSTLTANSEAIAHILLVTLMAGATGGIGATFCAWQVYEKPSISFMVNGILAGCVSITAACAFVNITSAAVIGFVGGALVVYATILLDKFQIDDPVGAVPVHLFCGVWGTLAVGLFSRNPDKYLWSKEYFRLDQGGLLFGGGINLLFAQLIGILLVGAFTVVFSAIAWIGISYFIYKISDTSNSDFKVFKSLRVLPQEEVIGLDSLFAEGNDIQQMKREYIETQRHKRFLQRKYSIRR
ncbi:MULTISPECIES: ammonium transporter [unclassified Tolypothrix]|uniref:ammonium transporter n=1 Tax=unclassified Tolypothrix TaxID=2649714 RepID=UPI0005EABB22|nr:MULTISPECIES: ammonium transporter [unclassified Tolypothrix]BAY88862.1 ammonium transporter [Microchaete diplosiphon NIES-3275]EKF02725.1 ammonium transporter [Tolypothrix sp. PCC 7601]MBE9084734.1 ammonium transporter [Tolypothrix sp. LEGE 11397]UYD29505.1 ammonium transporter [Tolypothrix sp. PCC 7712]UYD34583.1 ammonium transporter [Tolypothrix sp. PCC 7601]